MHKCDPSCHLQERRTELAPFLEWAPRAWRSWVGGRFLTSSAKSLFRTSDISHSEYRNLGCRSTISFFLCGVTSRPL